MAAPGFRLGGLLRLRRMQEDQAAAEAAQANAERRAAERRRIETAEMLAGTALPHSGDDLTWRAAIASRAAMTGLAGESVAALELADARVQQATEYWSDAKAKATALSKLEERHDAEVRAEEDRAEQLVLDEAALRGHGARSSRPGDDQQGAPDTTHPPTEGER